MAHTADDLSSSLKLELLNQVANSKRVQSQFNGLSESESRFNRNFVVDTSLETIVISLSSKRKSSRLFNGTTKSAVNDRKKLCVRSRVVNFSKCAKEALETSTIRLLAKSNLVNVDKCLNE